VNPLSLLNTAARASGAKDADSYAAREDSAAQRDPAADSFARMLDSPAPADRSTQAAPQHSQPTRREAERPREQEQAATQDPATQAKDRTEQTARSERGEPSAQGKEQPAEAAQTTASEEAGAKDAEATADNTETDATWPPPGLGGFGLMLLQPGAPAPDPAMAAAANAASGLMPALLQADAAPAASAGATTPGAAPALPHLGATPAVPATAAAAGTASSDATALAALATANAAGQARLADAGDSDAAPSIDTPTFNLPNLPHTAATGRTQDASPIFNASPTPTPNVHGEDFDEAVGTRLTWLAEQKIGHAHIKVTPNDLGPVEVHLQMDGDKVQASFTAAHAEVRQALEQSLPRLREMLGQHGFQLAHADVSAQQQGQRGDGGKAPAGMAGLGDGSGEGPASVVVPASVLRARGLLDAYA